MSCVFADHLTEAQKKAYEIKTGLSRVKLSHLMDAETWINAHKAIELGFSDGVLEDEKNSVAPDEAYGFSSKVVVVALMNKMEALLPSWMIRSKQLQNTRMYWSEG